MRTLSLLALLALTAFAPAAPAWLHRQPAAAATPSDSFSFLFEDQRLYVPVRIGGAAPRWFILDTGATPTVVDAAVADALGMPRNRADVTGGAGAGRSRVSESSKILVTVGHTPLSVDTPIVSDLAGLLGPTSGRAPAGIIGSQFFREHVVEIDFSKRTISLYPPGTDRSRSFEQSVPLSFVDHTPLTTMRLTLPSGRILPAHALVDLGAKSTFLIPEPFIDRHQLRAQFPRTVTTGLGAGMGGDTHYAFARAPRLAFAGAPAAGLSNVVVGLSVGGTLRSTWHEGLVGAEYLSRFRLAFDYAAARLLLTPVVAAPIAFDRSGLFLAADPTDLTRPIVRSVVQGSPAALAGMLAGDEIVRVDGAAARTIALPALREMLKSPERRSIALTYRRGSAERVAMVRLATLL